MWYFDKLLVEGNEFFLISIQYSSLLNILFLIQISLGKIYWKFILYTAQLINLKIDFRVAL